MAPTDSASTSPSKEEVGQNEEAQAKIAETYNTIGKFTVENLNTFTIFVRGFDNPALVGFIVSDVIERQMHVANKQARIALMNMGADEKDIRKLYVSASKIHQAIESRKAKQNAPATDNTTPRDT